MNETHTIEYPPDEQDEFAELNDVLPDDMTRESGSPTTEQEHGKHFSASLRRSLKKLVLWGLIGTGGVQTLALPINSQYERGRTTDSKITQTFHSIVQKETEFVTETADKVVEILKSKDEKYLAKVFSKQYLDNLQTKWDQEKINNGLESTEKRPEQVGIRDPELAGLTQQDIQAIWIEGYPKNWINTEVDSIIFEDQAGTMPADYGLGQDKKAAATAYPGSSGETTIKIHRGGYQTDFIGLDLNIAHELGHANDWESDNTLMPGDKKQLLLEVTHRYLEGKNCYHSDYVEEIKNPDLQQEHYRKISEYWAEICSAYFDFPNMLQAEHPEDFALVDQWVKKQDSNFEPNAAFEHRRQLSETFQEEHALARLPEAIRGDFEMIKAKFVELRAEEGVLDDSQIYKEVRSFSQTHQLDQEMVDPLTNSVLAVVEKTPYISPEQKLYDRLSPEVKNELTSEKNKHGLEVSDFLNSQNPQRVRLTGSAFDSVQEKYFDFEAGLHTAVKKEIQAVNEANNLQLSHEEQDLLFQSLMSTAYDSLFSWQEKYVH